MTSRIPLTMWLLLAGCVHGTPQTSSEIPSPSLFIEGVDVEDPAGEKPLPAGSALSRGQGFAIRLRSRGYLQIVEEQPSGVATFLVQVGPPSSQPAGSTRIPDTGFLHNSASAQGVCLVVSSKPLILPSCAEEDGRGEDRVPPKPPSPPNEPKADRPSPPPPPVRDDNRTRSPERVRLVRRLLLAS